MCRFAMYLGPPIQLSALVTEPSNSIIHQSYDAQERARSTDDITEHIAHLVEALHHYVVLATESSTQDDRRRHRANVRMVVSSLSTLDS